MKYLLILILVFVSNCTQKKTAKETLPFLNVVPLQTDLGANPIQQLMGNSLEVYEAKFELDYPALGFVTETLYEINLESPISIAESFLFCVL